MTPQEIQTTIAEHIATEHVLVESADNVHFYVTVVSQQFVGITRIKQHKLIKDLFTQQFANETIHAMSLKTITPEKWNSQQSESE